jgi:predicted lipoprotein with Yx(FWY)xxD motif
MSRAIPALPALSVGVLVAVAGCGGGSGYSKAAPSSAGGSSKTAPATTAAPAGSASKKAAPARGKSVTLHQSDYGRILADGKGLALYLFTHDSGKSRCYGACARAWPPLLTKGEPRAVGAVRQELLGTVKRSDGRTQVTYAGHPLYYYVGDRQPGQVLCQAVLEYGGYWYVVKGDGGAVR